MPTRNAKQALAGIGVFVLPVAVVKAAALVLGTGGPSEADAATDATTAVSALAPLLVAAPVAAWPAEVVAASGHAHALAAQPFGPSPMVEIAAAAPDPVASEPEVEGEPEPQLLMIAIAVQSIMASPQGDMAVVNQRVVREGDLVETTDWVVESIDARERTVTFRAGSTGELFTRRVSPN